jgi:hypothetical protein
MWRMIYESGSEEMEAKTNDREKWVSAVQEDKDRRGCRN